jgi:menaquinone-dependent protoporphyrinogen oxidase
MDKQTSVLVAYASKHGSTRGIAESIAEALRLRGARVDVRAVGKQPKQPKQAKQPKQPKQAKVDNLDSYDAFVIGSAVYFGFWRKDAVRFVRGNRAVLAKRPVWLFSSGPLGTKTTDPQGRDLRAVAEPKVINEFRSAIAPRDHRVFFGALELSKLSFTERMVTKMVARSAQFSEGDFRDQAEIRAWASAIAQVLEATQPAAH